MELGEEIPNFKDKVRVPNIEHTARELTMMRDYNLTGERMPFGLLFAMRCVYSHVNLYEFTIRSMVCNQLNDYTGGFIW